MIFIAHRNAISFLQQWTGIPFPFQKIGFVAIPDFQFGGMEHPGEVEYKASAVFLVMGNKRYGYSRQTPGIARNAHMWFGDMVPWSGFK